MTENERSNMDTKEKQQALATLRRLREEAEANYRALSKREMLNSSLETIAREYVNAIDQAMENAQRELQRAIERLRAMFGEDIVEAALADTAPANTTFQFESPQYDNMRQLLEALEGRDVVQVRDNGRDNGLGMRG